MGGSRFVTLAFGRITILGATGRASIPDFLSLAQLYSPLHLQADVWAIWRCLQWYRKEQHLFNPQFKCKYIFHFLYASLTGLAHLLAMSRFPHADWQGPRASVSAVTILSQKGRVTGEICLFSKMQSKGPRNCNFLALCVVDVCGYSASGARTKPNASSLPSSPVLRHHGQPPGASREHGGGRPAELWNRAGEHGGRIQNRASAGWPNPLSLTTCSQSDETDQRNILSIKSAGGKHYVPRPRLLWVAISVLL